MLTYFVQAETGGPIKIGRTTSLERRMTSLQTGSAVRLVVLATIEGDHEAELHERLDAHRMIGEWFAPTPEVMAVVRGAREGKPLPVVEPKAPFVGPRPAPPPRKDRPRWVPERRPDPSGSLAHDVMRRVMARAFPR